LRLVGKNASTDLAGFIIRVTARTVAIDAIDTARRTLLNLFELSIAIYLL
jgi:hypothetical protein